VWSAVVLVQVLVVIPAFASPGNSPNVVTVGKELCPEPEAEESIDLECPDFDNLVDAIASITDAGPTNPYVILVYPGIYTGLDNGCNVEWKSYVSLQGYDRYTTVIRGGEREGSYFGLEPAMINMVGLQGINISNITLDGSVNIEFDPTMNVAPLNVCGASVTLENVTCVNGDPGWGPGPCITTSPDATNTINIPCEAPANITIRSSDIAPIADYGGNWTISDTTIRAVSQTEEAEWVYAYLSLRDISQPGVREGRVLITGSVIEAVGLRDGLGQVGAIYIEGGIDEMHIVGSRIAAITSAEEPTYNTAGIQVIGSGSGSGLLQVEGSSIVTQSISGVGGGTFYGISVSGSDAPEVEVRGSSILSLGSGGTRADVWRDSPAPVVALSATTYGTVAGGGASGITTQDQQQGLFSTRLTIPLTTSAPSVNGSVWVDPSSNKFCYRSGGGTLCLAGVAP